MVYEETLYDLKNNAADRKSIHNLELDLMTGQVYEYAESKPYFKNSVLDPSWAERYTNTLILQAHSQSL